MKIFLLVFLFALTARADVLPWGSGEQHYVNECGFRTIGIYNSGDFGERWSQVVLGSTRYTVFHVTGIKARPGDILIALADGQATSERNTNTEFTTILNLYTPGVTGKLPMNEENGTNIDIDRHHEKVHSSGMIEIPSTHAIDDPVEVHWDWHAANGSTQPQYIWVGCGETCWKDYGRLIVTQLRPNVC